MCNSIINKRDDDLSYSSSEFTNNVGTPMYMAPEVKEDQYGPAADIYSLGIILFEMMWKIKTHSEKTRYHLKLNLD